MKVIMEEGQGLPIFNWCRDLEDGCLKQLKNLAALPFAFKHIAEMPDGHQGYGMPIGGVLATGGKKSTGAVIIPNAVGVDIGCGMRTMKTGIHISAAPASKLKEWMGQIRKAIPLGFNHRSEKVIDQMMPPPGGDAGDLPVVVKTEYESARTQLGTLGGGNHFIEFQVDENGMLWVTIHSGSRNLGKKVADHYNAAAVELNKKWNVKVPPEHQLAFLPVENIMAELYWEEMNYCVAFAERNRALMMSTIAGIICATGEEFDMPHNYAAWENHFGENVMVHRKGAMRARAGEIGIIPGSQGTASYIVEGLGNADSFMSCSHGAGRAMGRKEAQRKLNLEDEIRRMDEQGIIHGMRSKNDLDEAASAYKDIDAVIEQEKDLIKVVTRLKPVAVIKG